MKNSIVIALLALCFITPGHVRADDRATAEGLVKKAVAFYKANGAEKLIEEANNPKGQFVQGTIYVYIMTGDAIMLAFPMNTALIGQNTMGVLDADGRPLSRMAIDAGNGKTAPWIDYRYKNPKTNEIEPKAAYVEKIDDLFIVCGYYKK
jgi:hypothetical protein